MAAAQITALEKILRKEKPDLVLVQGDTTSALSGALAAYYLKIPIAHIEAGLRTESLFSPWPEEGHRRLIDQLSTYFFAPTASAKKTLLKEGVCSKAIWNVGNSSIDALAFVKKKRKPLIEKQVILVTIHRRENQGAVLEGLCVALKEVALFADDHEIIVFLHPNPAVREVLVANLGGVKNISLKHPLDYISFVRLMLQALFIITDSGGIQEEAPYLGKPLLVLRDKTERIEGVKRGTARLIGTSPDQVIAHCKELLQCKETLISMSKRHSPYGRGKSGKLIAKILEQVLK